MRGIGILEFVQQYVPQIIIPIFIALTFLGDVIFILSMTVVIYWWGSTHDFINHKNSVRFLAVVICGFAVIVMTKFLFELPRPPDTLRQISKTSYGFPSGHVTGATAFYGGLAIYSRWLNKHRRWILSIFAVTIIAFSRLVLGVHYFVDLLGGVVFGGISLILVHFLTNYDLRLGFLFAFTVALLSGYFAGLAQDSLLAIGGTFGVLLGQIISDFLGFQWASPSPVLAVAGFGICSSFLGGAYFLSNPTIVLLFSMIAGLGAISIPYIESQIPSYSEPIH